MKIFFERMKRNDKMNVMMYREKNEMDVTVNDLNELVRLEWDYPVLDGNSVGTQLDIKAADADVAGAARYTHDIDRLKDHPEVKSISVFGLSQETFEYLIKNYGQQLKYIRFFKNKAVEDWSLLGTLPELECVYWFHNQKITKLWDMSGNYALKAVVLDDFSKLHDISGIDKAPALEWFGIGDAVWSTAEIESLKPLVGTKVRRIDFHGKKIKDMDISFIPELKELEVFNFPTNLFATEECAWLKAKCPKLQGYSLRPYVEFKTFNEETRKTDVPAVIIVGKRKPVLVIEGNEKKIQAFAEKFDQMVEEYRKSDN